MNYFVDLLVGEAGTTVKGLTLCNQNYVIARDLLNECFGDNQTLISAHMSKLLYLNPILNISDLKTLRTLFDPIKSQARSLNSLDQDFANYGLILMPVLLTKLPSEYNLQKSRKCGKDVWDIREVLDLINLEIEAREKVVLPEEKSERCSQVRLYSKHQIRVILKCN